MRSAEVDPTRPERTLPAHADTTPRAAVVRNVLSICCLAETIAVALIGAERLEMPDGPLRELLTRIWSDEVGHARFGWRYLERELPSLDAAERDAVARYLPIALAAIEAHELAHIPAATTWPLEAAAYGLCSGDDARTLVAETFTEVIVPQLEALGLPAKRAWRAATASVVVDLNDTGGRGGRRCEWRLRRRRFGRLLGRLLGRAARDAAAEQHGEPGTGRARTGRVWAVPRRARAARRRRTFSAPTIRCATGGTCTAPSSMSPRATAPRPSSAALRRAELASSAGETAEHRPACCSALGHAPANHLAACTPWGPPCPPEMA